MRWLQHFFERLFGEHADDAVARLAVGRPSAEVERERRIEELKTAVEGRRKQCEIEELDHQQALRKLAEQEKAAEVRAKEAAAAEKFLDVQRKEAALERHAAPSKPEPPPSEVEKVLATFKSYTEASDWVQDTYRRQLEARGVKEPALAERVQKAQKFVESYFRTKGL